MWQEKIKMMGMGLLLCVSCLFCAQQVYATTVTYQINYAKTQTTLIDVPLENQNTGTTPLGNGCEVTALSMLLNYAGYQTDKNQLAEQLTYVPVYEDEANDIHGDPREGFVGDISGGYNAMGVFVEPIVKVAKQIVNDDTQVIAGEQMAFSQVAQQVASGNPVWAIVTLDFQVPTAEDFKTWQTTSGSVQVSPLCHAVVITGMDQNYVYVNDPYGIKDRAVKRSDFIKIYQAMGSQALYLDAAT